MKNFKTLSKRGLALFLALMMCVSLLPATAMAAELNDLSADGRELICGKEAHSHTEECYETVSDLICGVEESHVHGEDCYAPGEPVLACASDEEGHVHMDACYVPGERVLRCDKAEGHVHSEDCYTESKSETLICALEEHEHSEECYAPAEQETEVPEIPEIVIPEGATLVDPAWLLAANPNAGKAMLSAWNLFGLVRDNYQDVLGGNFPETLTFVGETVNETVWYEDTQEYDPAVIRVTGDAIIYNGEPVTVYFQGMIEGVDEPETLGISGPTVVQVGNKITLYGTRTSWNYNHQWTSSDDNVATVAFNGDSAVVTGVSAGSVTITHRYSSWNKTHEETHTITVEEALLATGIQISGQDTVAEFSTIKLTASLTPVGSSAEVSWSSSNPAVATVDRNGAVTGITAGTVTIIATIIVDGSPLAAIYNVMVTAAEKTNLAEFYYLKTPTSDPASNDTGAWGETIGNGFVNLTGAVFVNNKNCFVSSEPNRVTSWPEGFENGVVPRTSKHWTIIFNAFKGTLGDNSITENDIESITLKPYKISNNDTYHVDCQVVIKAKQFATATFYLWDAGSTGYVHQYAETVRTGSNVSAPEIDLPETKIVDGRTYRLVTWHDNHSLNGSAVSFPYTVTKNVDFYAKYVANYVVTYNLGGGAWEANPQTIFDAGDQVTVAHTVPTKLGYRFTGWQASEGGSLLMSGSVFTMPEHDVTLTAQWELDEDQKHELTYTVKYYQNDVQAGETDTVANEFQILVTEQAVTGVNTTPATGYKLDKILVNGEEVNAVPATAVDNTVIEVYFGNRTDLPYMVNYYLENTITPVAPSKTVENQTFGASVTENAIAVPNYVVEGMRTKTITIGVENNVINFYYTADRIGPNGGSDGTPDKYQATVTFTVVNGTWTGGGTTRSTVVTLRNAAGEMAADGTYTLRTGDIPTGTANAGYANGVWGANANPNGAVIDRRGASYELTYAPAGTTGPVFPPPDPGPGTDGGTTTIPENPTPLGPDPDGATTILDEEVPLANAVGLNITEHFAYIIGYEDDTVRPLKNITRAEAVTIFFRLMEDDYRAANWSMENPFSDVNAGNWHNNAVSTCLKAGALKHFAQDAAFLPNQAITRAEFASIAAGFVSDEITGESIGDFSDTEGHWAAADIRKAVEAGWIKGVGGNRFAPDETITRAEVMTIVNRMLDRVPDAEHMLPNMKKWLDNPEDAWYYEAVQEATNEHDYDVDEFGAESWTEILEARDWKSLENEWANNGGMSASAEPVKPEEGAEGEGEAEDAGSESEEA